MRILLMLRYSLTEIRFQPASICSSNKNNSALLNSVRHLRLLLLINSHFSGILTHYLQNFWKNQLKKFSVYKREITVSLFLDKFFSKSSIYTNGTTMNFKNSFSLQFSVVSSVGAQMGRTTSSKSCAKSSSENDGPTLSSMLIQNSP